MAYTENRQIYELKFSLLGTLQEKAKASGSNDVIKEAEKMIKEFEKAKKDKVVLEYITALKGIIVDEQKRDYVLGKSNKIIKESKLKNKGKKI